MWLACPPAERLPPTTYEFLRDCCSGHTDKDDLARFIIEDGFLEAVAREPFHWLQKAHEVMFAIYQNATDPKRKDQKVWCEYFFARLKEMSDAVRPFKGKLSATQDQGRKSVEFIDDSGDVVLHDG